MDYHAALAAFCLRGMMAEPKVTKRKLAEFQPARVNPNRGTPRGLDIIENSIAYNGAGRPMLADKDGEMIAGSHSIQAFINRGFEEALVIESDGSTPIIFQRTDVDIEDPRGRSLQISDNRASEIGYDPDDELLAALLQDIGAQDAALVQAAGFDDADVRALMENITPPNADYVDIPSQYMILIECGTESEQARLLERFNTEGLQCRALIS